MLLHDKKPIIILGGTGMNYHFVSYPSQSLESYVVLRQQVISVRARGDPNVQLYCPVYTDLFCNAGR